MERGPFAPSEELVAMMAEELLGLSMLEEDVVIVSRLLQNLAFDMEPVRKLVVGERDPATTYDPSFL